MAGAFLWEEVLASLGGERRRVLAVVCDLGGGDDDLVSVAIGAPGDLGRALHGVPLVGRRTDGWYVPHALWRTVSGVVLEPLEQVEVRSVAVARLCERGRFEDAFALVCESGLWDLAPSVLRGACLASDRRRPRQLEPWLAACPERVLESPFGHLAGALHAAFTDPADAIPLLRAAAGECRAAGDVHAELCSIAQLGRLGWFRQDRSAVGPELGLRVLELARAGHPQAQALASFGRATVADLNGDDAAVLSAVAGIESGVLDPGWELMASWLCGVVRLDMGEAEVVCEMISRIDATSEPGLRVALDGLRLRAWWTLGKVDEVLAEAPAVIAAVRSGGVASTLHLVLSNSSVLYSHTGNIVEARHCLDEGTAAVPAQPSHGQPVRTALATASLQLAEGRDDQAAHTLREAIERHGLDKGIDRRGWRQLLPLTYVLVPETRQHWDGLDLQGHLRTSRRLAKGVVAARHGDRTRVLQSLELPPVAVIRSALHFRLAAELAAGLAAAAGGRSAGAALLDSLGPPGRHAVRELTTVHSTTAKAARALLAAVPAPPPRTTYLAVLGPLAVQRSGMPTAAGQDDSPPELGRRRVHELLAFLVSHRSTTRAAINATLWPDLCETRPGNNLAVTLNHLLRALEPWRPPGEAPHLVRVDGHNVRLVTGEHLRIDLDDFDRHVAAAAHAEHEGVPSLALEHHLAATAIYRGDLHVELSDTDWIALDRGHYRTRFVTSAIRAAQLLTGHGDTHQAAELARRALDVDPWAEDAHVALAAALARGDRSAARRTLQRCLTALFELGIQPSATTRQLQRRIHTHTDTPAPKAAATTSVRG